MLLVTALMMLTLGQDESQPLSVSNGGFCTVLAWVATSDADTMSVDSGPDFKIFCSDRSQTEGWGIYVGRHAQVSSGTKVRLFERNGVIVDRVHVDGRFRGYLATDKRGVQNHFFGSPFDGSRKDLTFFDRVDFGPEGQAKCAKAP